MKELESITFTKQRRRRITREVIIIGIIGIIKLIQFSCKYMLFNRLWTDVKSNGNALSTFSNSYLRILTVKLARLEPMEAALSVPFLNNVQTTTIYVHIVVAEATQRLVTTSLCGFLCGYYAIKWHSHITTQNRHIPAKKVRLGWFNPCSTVNDW